jgi:two-component system, chemotaxis family, chemotaxis protein CheY
MSVSEGLTVSPDAEKMRLLAQKVVAVAAEKVPVPAHSEFSCLIVEDSPMIRQLLVFALARVKHLRVTESDDGVDGLRKLQSAHYDVIITDINMPTMDGLKLVKRVRSDPVNSDTPIIVITTEGSQEDRQRALSLGANAYIAKPIQAPQVIAKVKELLKIE